VGGCPVDARKTQGPSLVEKENYRSEKKTVALQAGGSLHLVQTRGGEK